MADNVNSPANVSATDLQAMIAGASKIPAPIFYVTSAGLFRSSNDFILVCNRQHPVIIPTLKEGQAAAINEPTAILQMSAQTLKDLYLATKDQIERYEKEFGNVETEYSRKLQGAK
jgi:hypothetical protein